MKTYQAIPSETKRNEKDNKLRLSTDSNQWENTEKLINISNNTKKLKLPDINSANILFRNAEIQRKVINTELVKDNRNLKLNNYDLHFSINDCLVKEKPPFKNKTKTKIFFRKNIKLTTKINDKKFKII